MRQQGTSPALSMADDWPYPVEVVALNAPKAIRE
jgi:hypothetical protein